MNNLNDYIDICIGSNGSHYDVAKVIYELIKDKFNYSGKNIWRYIDDNGENIIDEKQIKLKNVLKSTVINTFIIRSNYWDDKAIVQNDINIALDYQIKSSTLLQIANKLKEDKYLNCIIKELKQFFNNIIDD
jgi:hypothetical protein